MNRLILLIGMFSFTGAAAVISCLHDSPEVKGYHFYYSVPLPKKNGSIIRADSFYDVFYYGDLMMYRAYYLFDSTFNNGTILQIHRSFYFIFNKDSAYGRAFYKEPHFEPWDRVSVDYIKKKVRLESDAYDNFLSKKPDSSYSDSGNLVKIYQIEPTAAFPEKYTYSFYYSPNINPPTEYFSKTMDNVKGMRLFRIKMFAHGGYWPQEDFNYPERELKLEMSTVSELDKTEAMEYFRKYLEKNK
jgi:hypothetical protein